MQKLTTLLLNFIVKLVMSNIKFLEEAEAHYFLNCFRVETQSDEVMPFLMVFAYFRPLFSVISCAKQNLIIITSMFF